MHNNEVVLATELGQQLIRRRWKVTTAESCTGGGVAQAITAIAGSSQWFEQGFVTYSNKAKEEQLNVSKKLLLEQGAVSGAVVVAMAKGALKRANADIAVAISGVAGPDGGTAEKPVGTVWIAWATRSGKYFSHLHQLSGNRATVRQQAVTESLKGLNLLLKENTV